MTDTRLSDAPPRNDDEMAARWFAGVGAISAAAGTANRLAERLAAPAPIVPLRARPLAAFAKRIFDLAAASVLLLLFAPLMLLVALYIRRDGGPVLYRQTRMGQGGTDFGCIKFRSMQVDAESRLAELLRRDPAAAAEWRAARKLRKDPRVTQVGSYIRATSLDELPQLFNVLRGDMSLVGPRPIVASELPLYGRDAQAYVAARPGMTGLWQVSGRSDVSYPDRVRLDAYYVQNWTFWLDITILLRTVSAVLRRCGAV
jgi:undecaprenyl-phosphate galactose phosphotransferase